MNGFLEIRCAIFTIVHLLVQTSSQISFFVQYNAKDYLN